MISIARDTQLMPPWTSSPLGGFTMFALDMTIGLVPCTGEARDRLAINGAVKPAMVVFMRKSRRLIPDLLTNTS